MHLSANEIDVSFQYRYANQVRSTMSNVTNLALFTKNFLKYPKAIRLVAGGLINVKPLVTHRFKLEEAVSAFHVAADPTQGAIKVQIQD
jgi:L-iditol 2-dehydrogenase